MRTPATVEPMLAKIAEAVPPEGEFLYEPKWDGFRAIVFRDAAGVRIQSRDLKPLDRYFPELHAALLAGLPGHCVLDGEIVIAGAAGLDFDALLQRVHPAASRIERLARETPASFVAFDLLALDGRDLQRRGQSERRMLLEAFMADVGPPIHLTPMTESRAVALQWLDNFEGAGLDGVVAKRADGAYLPGERAMFKVKHVRTADCVLAGLRWHKSSTSGAPAVGSLLLGLWDAQGVLQHVGATSSFDMATRRALARELAPLMRNAGRGHPWIGADEAATAALQARQRAPGARTRWNSGKDLSWVPLRPERVCEVRYDHLQGERFRHGAIFVRWRPDKPPAACTYAQCEVTPPYELARVFAAERERPTSP
jgi:ATP-dependent DNA ligase